MILWHYTCAHGIVGIVRTSELRPNRQVQLDGRKLVWLTDLDAPTRWQLGLTSHTLPCDRTAYRIPVDTDLAVPWLTYLRGLSRELRALARHNLHQRGTLPAHWWVAETALPLTLDGATV